MKTSLSTASIALAACGLLAGCGQNEQVTTTTSTAVSTSTPQATATTTAESPTTTAEATAPGGSDATETKTSAAAPTRSPSAVTRTDSAKALAKEGATVSQKDPGDYADAAVAAWSARDAATLKKYVSPKATAGVTGAPPAGELLRTACDGDMCSYTTEDGKRVTLTMDLDAVKAGRTGAITGVKVG